MATQQFELRSPRGEFVALRRYCLLWFIGVPRLLAWRLKIASLAPCFLAARSFLAMPFTAAALAGAILIAFATQPEELIGSASFQLARAAAYNSVNVYMVKMAAFS